MCGHYLVEPVACTPASGWEKDQVVRGGRGNKVRFIGSQAELVLS
jgi:hypothetical protein